MSDSPGSDRLFEALVVSAEEVIVSTDLQGRIVFVNDAGKRLYGVERAAEILGASAFDLLAPECREAALTGMHSVLADGVIRDREYELLRGDGSRVPIEMTVSLLRGDDGAPAGFVSVCRDISTRKLAERRSSFLLEIARVLASESDRAAALDFVQRRAAEVLGCEAVITFLRDEGADSFRLAGRHEATAGALPDFGSVEFRRQQPDVLRFRDRPVVVVDGARGQDELPPEWMARFGLSAVAWAQLIVRGQPLGGIALISTRPGSVFDTWQINLLEGVAQQLALYLEAEQLRLSKDRETHVARALARAGQELMAGLEGENFNDRLCEVTAELLQCDTSHTLLREADSDLVRLAGAYGYEPEQREAFAALRIPPEMMDDALARAAGEQVIVLDLSDAHPNALARAGAQVGIQRSICIALYRGREAVGLLVAARRDGRRRFTPAEDRIARGLGQLASIALQYRIALDDLASANRLKSDFVAAISHELRTPLNIIMGYSSLLLEGAFGALPAEQGEALGRIDRSAANLFELITEMLDLSRLETGRVQLDVRPVDVARLVEDVEAEAHELRRSGVEWAIRVEGVPIVRTDPIKLKVVLKNLVTNAFKFTEAGRVTVSVAQTAAGITVVVEDTGGGIPPGSERLIFEAFRQATEPARRQSGVGLGLYIVKRLLEILGGQIEVESELGKGTAFRVSLPPQPVAGRMVEARAET